MVLGGGFELYEGLGWGDPEFFKDVGLIGGECGVPENTISFIQKFTKMKPLHDAADHRPLHAGLHLGDAPEVAPASRSAHGSGCDRPWSGTPGAATDCFSTSGSHAPLPRVACSPARCPQPIGSHRWWTAGTCRPDILGTVMKLSLSAFSRRNETPRRLHPTPGGFAIMPRGDTGAEGGFLSPRHRLGRPDPSSLLNPLSFGLDIVY